MTISPLEFDTAELFVPPLHLGREPHLGYIELAKLVVDHSYQRPVDAHSRQHVLKIAAAFDWSLFGALVVCPLGNEKFAIIDGQHRALAALLVNALKVPCIINFGDHKAQARAFSAINGQVKPVTLFNIYRAALAAGEAWAVAARDLVLSAGCRLMDCNRPVPERKTGEIYNIAFFRALVDEGRDTLRCRAASLALKALAQSSAGISPAAFAPVPVQAWISAVYACSPASTASLASLIDCLITHDFLGIIDDAYLHVAVRRDKGLPSVGVLEQLTQDLTGMLEDWFDKRGRT